MIFCKKDKNLDLNKRKEKTVESLTTGPARQCPREHRTPSPANARRRGASPADPRAPACS